MFDYSIMIELEKIIRPKSDEKNFLIAWIYKYHNKIEISFIMIFQKDGILFHKSFSLDISRINFKFIKIVELKYSKYKK